VSETATENAPAERPPADAAVVERSNGVALVRLRAGENRFNPGNLDAFEAALDEVEVSEGDGTPLVLTGEGKFFSNGLDLDWMSSAPQGEPEKVLDRVHALFARVLAFPALTVAAINGHAFAAGGMLALAFDQRVMRADRGFFCLPEADLGIPFTPGMSALISSKLTPATANEAMVTGRRYGGTDAERVGIVDDAVPEEEVVDRAVARAAAGAGKQAVVIAAIKRELYGSTLAALGAEPG
jgi:enoyl-CoA hydratase/carnithine racemase